MNSKQIVMFFLVLISLLATSCSGLESYRLPSSALEQSSCSELLLDLFKRANDSSLVIKNDISSFLEGGRIAAVDELSNESTTDLLREQILKYERNDNRGIEGYFEQMNTPRPFRRFYDPKTGLFQYTPEEVADLAVENGSKKLSAVRINFLPELEVSRSLLDDYANVLKEEDFQLLVTVPAKYAQKAKELVRRYPEEVRSKIKVIAVDTEDINEGELSIWAQDLSKPLADGHSTYRQSTAVVEQRTRLTDTAFVDALGKREDFKVRVSDLSFEGGNIVVGEKKIIMGPDSIYKLMNDLNINYAQALETFEKEFGKPIVVLGYPSISGGEVKLNQIAFHADLTVAVIRNRMNPNGPETAVLSSLDSLLSKLFGISIEVALDQTRYTSKVNSLLADKSFMAGLTEKEKLILNILAVTHHSEIAHEIMKSQYAFLVLKNAGYDVREVPYFHSFKRVQQGVNLHLGHEMSRETVGMINYTNVVISDDMVLMPDFGSPKLQAIAEKTYEELGYSKIYSATASSEYTFCLEGGIRCTSETFR